MNYSTNILKLILWLLCKFWYILTLVDVHNKLVSTLTEGSVLFLFLSRFQYERYTKYFTFIVTNRLLKLTRHKRFIKQYQTNQYILLILISYKYHSSWSILVQKVYKYVDVSVFVGRDSINILHNLTINLTNVMLLDKLIIPSRDVKMHCYINSIVLWCTGVYNYKSNWCIK